MLLVHTLFEDTALEINATQLENEKVVNLTSNLPNENLYSQLRLPLKLLYIKWHDISFLDFFLQNFDRSLGSPQVDY